MIPIELARLSPAFFLVSSLTGFGVAALSTGGTMMMTDVSTPLNRAITIAPIMSAFAAGTALGPALGGFLVDSVGLHPTFYLCGLSFMGVAALNKVIMQETKQTPIYFPWQDTRGADMDGSKESVLVATKRAMAQWSPLMENSNIRSVMIMNSMYWIALAGAQMTILPLIMTDSAGLAMSATQVGQAYMGMSLVQIFGNPVFAKLADRIGKAPAIVGGCTLISGSMAALPFASDFPGLAMALGVWAVGSSMLSTAPVAYISDQVKDEERAQALALLRTCGDVGFLIGASATGALADWAGSLDIAMQTSSALLATATVWFGVRQNITTRLRLALKVK
jgi:MFS family permease